jgi:trehalose 6-phosphate synthase
MWTKRALHDLIHEKLRDHKLIIVANREPYIHRFVGEHIECTRPASGMASALDPIVRACGGIWVGHGSGTADRQVVDERDHVLVPPEDPAYTLRRVWLTKEQEEGYYYGISNEAIWPLCHITFTRPVFRSQHWDAYREVNELFAKAVLEEANGYPAFVFIQDYHFGLLPRMLKNANSNLIIAQFWHIPWPNREVFRVFPWKEELLDGLLANDVLGFHTRYHCQNFLDTIDRNLEARVDQERSEVIRGGRTTLVRPFPISIDYERHQHAVQNGAMAPAIARWRKRLRLRDQVVGIGIERMDYTKGIPERLQAIDRFLEKNPAYRQRLMFVQIAVPSRGHIAPYQAIEDEIDRLVEHINWKWSTGAWRPVVLLKEHANSEEMMALHLLADFCMVTSLHDGMNLVAKEYVASRFDDGGALILSEFTGAARELRDALLVNPFAIDEMADAIRQALEMPDTERRRRMQRMRQEIEGNNVYRWAGKIVSTLLKFEFPEGM